MRKALVLLILSSCGAEGREIYAVPCTMDGRYELTLSPLDPASCAAPEPLDVPFYDEAGECSARWQETAVTGVTFDVSLTCRPGSPVLECEGFTTFSTGCAYSTTLRRVASAQVSP